MKTQGVAPVLQVSSLHYSLNYYKDVLGFTEDFRFGDYAGESMGRSRCICVVTTFTNGPSEEARPVFSAMKSTPTTKR
jgi:hypothetical protein